MKNSRPVVILTAGYLLSLSAAFFMSGNLLLRAAQAAYWSFCGTMLLFRFCPPRTKFREAAYLGACGFFLGVCLFFLYYRSNIQPLEGLQGRTSQAVVRISERSVSASGRIRYVGRIEHLDTLSGSKGAKIQVFADKELEIGETYVGLMTFSLPKNSSTFDYKSYQAAKGIHIHGTFEEELYHLAGYSHPTWTEKLRQSVNAGFERYLSPESAAFAAAITLGDRSGLDPGVSGDITRAGLSHMMAISGLHLNVLAEMLSRLLNRMGMGKRISAGGCMVFVLLYMLLVGYNAAVIRAGIMSCIRFTGQIIWRRPDMLNSLAVAALLTALYNPYAIQGTSFVLSYTAILLIIYLNPRTEAWWRGRFPALAEKKYLGRVLSLLNLSISINLGMLPLNILYFRRVSLVSPITTLLVQPFMSVILIACFLTALFGLVPYLGVFAWLSAGIADLGIRIFTGIAHLFGGLPFSQLYIWGVYLLYDLLICGGVIFISRRRRGKVTRRAVAICIAALVFVGGGKRYLGANDVILILPNVETSSSFALVHSRGTVVVLKNTNYYDGRSLVSLLEDRGIEEVDMLVVTDGRSATVNTAQDILDRYTPTCIMAPEGLAQAEYLISYGDCDLELDGWLWLSVRGDTLVLQMEEFSLGVLGRKGSAMYTDLVIPGNLDRGSPVSAGYALGKALYHTNIPVIISNDYDEIVLRWHRGELRTGGNRLDLQQRTGSA